MTDPSANAGNATDAPQPGNVGDTAADQQSTGAQQSSGFAEVKKEATGLDRTEALEKRVDDLQAMVDRLFRHNGWKGA